MPYKCEKCGSPTRMQVQAVISAPGELAHQFSKTNLRRKDVYLMGVLWETATYICENEGCGHVLKAERNDATNLKKRVEELEMICAEGYQVIGILADECGRFVDSDVNKAMDNLSQQKMIHDDVLPFKSKGAKNDIT